MRFLPQRPPAAGFTLIELLVAIGIIGILASLSFTGIRKATADAMRTKCAGNLKTWGNALALYTADHDQKLPGPAFATVAYSVTKGQLDRAAENANGNVGGGAPLLAYLYPYVGQAPDTGSASQAVIIEAGKCPQVNKDCPKAPNQYYRSANRNGSGLPDPFGYFFAADSPQNSLPMTMAALRENHKKGLDRIPLMSCLDGQNQSTGGDGITIPKKAVHDHGRNYVFMDGHVEYRKVPDTAGFETSDSPLYSDGYRN